MPSPEHLAPRSGADPAREEEETDSAQAAQLLELAGFALRAARRRRGLSTSVFALGGLMTVAAALFAPRVYLVDTSILAQRNVVMPLLGNPHRAVPADSDAPTRAVDETIRRRDNLVAVVRETALLERWETGRSPILKLKDALARSLFGPISEEDTMRALIDVLNKKLTVQAAEPTIKISIVWHDPQMAFQLVSSLEGRFLNDRSAFESGAINETIAILEDEAALQREAIDSALAGMQERIQATQRAVPGSVPGRAVIGRIRRIGRVPPAPDGTDMAPALAAKRQAIQMHEEAGQRRLAELQTRLAELRVTYAPAHPSVIALEEKIRHASLEPPELVELKQAERKLLDQARGSAPPAGGPRSAPTELPIAPAWAPAAAGEPEDQPELIASRARLLTAVRTYEELKERIDSARIELRTSEAAFKYRYAVVAPPQMPRKPMKPNVALVLSGGLALSVVAAVCAALARELASNRFIEPWQARRLPIPLLAEVNKP